MLVVLSLVSVTCSAPARPRPEAAGPESRIPADAGASDACGRDADCVVSLATGACGPCGGCPEAMSAAEAARREQVQRACPPRPRDESVQCAPCPVSPVAAACVERRCVPRDAEPSGAQGIRVED